MSDFSTHMTKILIKCLIYDHDMNILCRFMTIYSEIHNVLHVLLDFIQVLYISLQLFVKFENAQQLGHTTVNLKKQ